jgi:DNA invertase Pin-like site-specific DNA recombinase
MPTKRPALAYLRTSSKTNVGEDKDTHKRQMAAIEAHAAEAGYAIVLPPFYDAVVKGADAIDKRKGFRAMLAYLAEHPECNTIIVEDAERFARGTLVQELGYQMLKDLGITLISAADPDQFVKDTPEAVLIRQIRGAISQFQKDTIVTKLRVARMRKRAANGKCEGRKSHAEAHPDVVKMARELRWINKRMKERRSFRDIAAELAAKGHLSASGKPYGPSAVRSMLLNR